METGVAGRSMKVTRLDHNTYTFQWEDHCITAWRDQFTNMDEAEFIEYCIKDAFKQIDNFLNEPVEMEIGKSRHYEEDGNSYKEIEEVPASILNELDEPEYDYTERSKWYRPWFRRNDTVDYPRREGKTVKRMIGRRVYEETLPEKLHDKYIDP
jgi:hypothetical protein